MVTSFAAGQEKHATRALPAQKTVLLVQRCSASAFLRKQRENAIRNACVSTQPYPGQFCLSGQKPHMMT
jgi:hypothetical protein